MLSGKKVKHKIKKSILKVRKGLLRENKETSEYPVFTKIEKP
nr:MAG: hypothetical protein [Bacteriophage sp.]